MKKYLMNIYHKMPYGIRTVGSKAKKAIYRKKYKRDVDLFLKSYQYQNPELFDSIEIETVNRCNGTCSFCPVNVNQPQREYAKMNSKLFEKIISELHMIDYNGELALFSNNEPFLDERIIEFSKMAKDKVPNACLYLYTNGTCLNMEKVKSIMRYLDILVIDNYDEKSTPLFDEIIEWSKVNDKRIIIAPRSRNEVLTSRGGQAPNKHKVKASKAKCFLPFKQLIIRPDGKVSLCCNDALGKYTLGDLHNQTILEVWNSEKYKEIRMKMGRQGRKGLMLCNQCDTENYTGTTKKSLQ